MTTLLLPTLHNLPTTLLLENAKLRSQFNTMGKCDRSDVKKGCTSKLVLPK
ncbi:MULTISPECIES: hypothetical protein [unclassified Tolypothrix]|uniref:hypothetical protein n=1 Tax=unclassified Tolypothrix TaxID=2649714 RepID=UPI0005EAB524|nr:MULTISPECIES: hypothetical protein [unclassified Tolypothrix]EKF03074.1 hypothetical protein FDUTEX481_05877 [Tolypothrix sp. PCC 7601]MBE9083836.1 hypothetical protein [Tolypothrix sp. LEGE 11397]UYD26858.1 hypothetical protein HGR01_01740 [Tolypothrix sp. PCC 7712]UYD37283.1 hypothetical protein HG267_17070 [Tolypothrix sp. PCC 7601]